MASDRKESDLRSIVRSSGTVTASKKGKAAVDRRTAAFALPALLVLLVGLPLTPHVLDALVWVLALVVAGVSASYALTYRAGAKAALRGSRRALP